MRTSPLLIHGRSGCVVCGGPTIPAARRSGVTSHSSAFCTSTSRRASKPRARAGLPRDLEFFLNNKKNSKKTTHNRARDSQSNQTYENTHQMRSQIFGKNTYAMHFAVRWEMPSGPFHRPLRLPSFGSGESRGPPHRVKERRSLPHRRPHAPRRLHISPITDKKPREIVDLLSKKWARSFLCSTVYHQGWIREKPSHFASISGNLKPFETFRLKKYTQYFIVVYISCTFLIISFTEILNHIALFLTKE